MGAHVPSRVFLTGASGFIARALATRYREAGSQVAGTDLAADPARGVVAGDIATPGAWQEAVAGCDLVIHTAALVTNAAGLDASWRVNVLGTRNVVEAAARAEVSRLVHFSSVRAFSDLGFPDGVTEAHPVRPDGNPYVDTKIASEQVVLQAHAAGELDCTVVRPGDVYGPGSRPWTLLPLEYIRAGRFLLPARGRGTFSAVYVDDLADGVMLAATHPDAAGQVFTLGPAAGVSTREFFGHYYRMLGRRGPICLPTAPAVALAAAADRVERLRGNRTEVNAASMRYLARSGGYSIEKACRMLGYAPAVSLDEGMRCTEAWLRAEGLLG